MNEHNKMYHISFYIKRKQTLKSFSKKNHVILKTKGATEIQEDCVSFLFLFSCLSDDIEKVTICLVLLWPLHTLIGTRYAFPGDCVMPSRKRCLEEHKNRSRSLGILLTAKRNINEISTNHVHLA